MISLSFLGSDEQVEAVNVVCHIAGISELPNIRSRAFLNGDRGCLPAEGAMKQFRMNVSVDIEQRAGRAGDRLARAHVAILHEVRELVLGEGQRGALADAAERVEAHREDLGAAVVADELRQHVTHHRLHLLRRHVGVARLGETRQNFSDLTVRRI